jgi:hypothetical protein
MDILIADHPAPVDPFNELASITQGLIGQKKILYDGYNELISVLNRDGNVTKQELMSIINKTLTKNLLYENNSIP